MNYKINNLTQRIMKLNLTLTFLLSVGFFFTIQAQEVKFSVNLENVQLEPGSQVVVRGNIPELGDWSEDGELVLRNRGQENIYEGTMDLDGFSKEILYKYVVIKRDGTEQWEERGNRQLNPQNQEIVWFDDRQDSGIQRSVVQVTFRLDLTDHAMNGIPAEGVALLGGREPLSYDIETGRTELTEVEEGVWETTVSFLYGTPHDVPFKFAWKHMDEWMWESSPGHINHVFWIDDTQSEQTVSLKYDVTLPGLVPVPGTSGLVDNYGAIIDSLGENGQQSRYMYEWSITQLKNDQVEEARRTYSQYQSTHPGGEEIDDFHYLMAYKIADNNGVEAAEAFANEQLKNEGIPERRAYFEYLKGEIKLNTGQREQARRHFRNVLALPESWELAEDYSQKALIHSYVLDTNKDSTLKGVKMLERQVQTAPPKDSRGLYTRLARAYERVDSLHKRDQILQSLTRTGTQLQRMHSGIELAETFIREDRYREASAVLGGMEMDEKTPKAYRKKFIRAKIQADYHTENYESAYALMESFSTEWPGDPYQKRFGEYKENILTLKEEEGSINGFLKKVRNGARSSASSDTTNYVGGE